jgi:hypothetical protein
VFGYYYMMWALLEEEHELERLEEDVKERESHEGLYDEEYDDEKDTEVD